MFECELCGRCCFTEELLQFLLVSAVQTKIMNAIDVCEFFASYFQKCVVKFPPGRGGGGGVMFMFSKVWVITTKTHHWKKN